MTTVYRMFVNMRWFRMDQVLSSPQGPCLSAFWQGNSHCPTRASAPCAQIKTSKQQRQTHEKCALYLRYDRPARVHVPQSCFCPLELILKLDLTGSKFQYGPHCTVCNKKQWSSGSCKAEYVNWAGTSLATFSMRHHLTLLCPMVAQDGPRARVQIEK